MPIFEREGIHLNIEPHPERFRRDHPARAHLDLQSSPRRSNPHRACCAAGAQLPAISCLGASRTLAFQPLYGSVIQASQKPAQKQSC